MEKNLIAEASTTINAPINKVWDALVNPSIIDKYMFSTTAITDWKEGSEIRWQREFNGIKYEDKGKVIKSKPEKLLIYSHFCPLTGKEDVPKNYDKVIIRLSPDENKVLVSLGQDHNPDEKSLKNSERNWARILDALKVCLEEK